MSFQPSISPTSPLTPASARQVVGEWLTYCRLAREPGEEAPPIVHRAAMLFSADRDKHLTSVDREHMSELMRAARQSSSDTTLARLARFPQKTLPADARVITRLVRTASTKRPANRREWTQIALEMPAPWPNYAFRIKATQRGRFITLTSLKRGRRTIGAPTPYAWRPLTATEQSRLPAYARMFLRCMSTPTCAGLTHD